MHVHILDVSHGFGPNPISRMSESENMHEEIKIIHMILAIFSF